MAVNKYTTEALLSLARLRAFVPTDTQSWPDVSVLQLFNDELTDWLAPLVLGARQGHFEVSYDLPLTAGTNTYQIPTDALGAEIYSLVLVDSSGSPSTTPLASKALEEVSWMWTAQGTPDQYTFQGDSILLYPTPDGAYPYLRIKFPRRPSQLVATSECATVLQSAYSYSTASQTGSLTFGSSLAFPIVSGASLTPTTSTPYDLVAASAPFDLLGRIYVTSVVGSSVSFTPIASGSQGLYPVTPVSPPSSLSASAYLCPLNCAPVLTGVPSEMYSFLAQRIAVKMCEAKGDAEALGRALEGLKQAQDRALTFLGKRDRGAHKKVVSSRGRFNGWPYRYFFPLK